jgi:hypothetical protein
VATDAPTPSPAATASASPTAAPSDQSAASEAVSNLTVAATLDKSGSLDLVEHIEYQFAGSATHDITFSIPLSYPDDQGQEFRLAFKLLSAAQNGTAIKPTVTTDPAAAHVTLAAGATSPSYDLHYTLAPIVLRGETADVFKISTTGQGWSVPLSHVSFTFHTPGLIADNLTCRSGASAAGTCEISQTGNTATVTTHVPLVAGDSLSLFCSFPKNSFASYLQPYQSPQSRTKTTLIIALPLLALAALIWVLYRVRKSYILKRNEGS